MGRLTGSFCGRGWAAGLLAIGVPALLAPTQAAVAAVGVETAAPPVAMAAAGAVASWQSLVPPQTPVGRVLEQDGHLLFAAALLLELLFFALMFTGQRSRRLQDAVMSRVRPWTLGTVLCMLAYFLLFRLLLLPLGYVGYRIDRHYGIAVQGTAHWFGDVARSWGVQAAVLVPTMLILLWGIRRSPKWWWLFAAAVTSAISGVLIYLAPLVIDPLYHKFTPLRDASLRDAILQLAARAHVHVNGVYVGAFSSTTTEGNAYVTGLGSSQRIVLWDTILKLYPPQELESVVAHELGHYALHHILFGLLLGAAGSLLIFLVVALVLERAVRRGWLREQAEPAAVLIIAAVVLLLNLLGLPIANAVSRAMERQADHFSLALTRQPMWFIEAMQRLSIQDYSNPWPNPVEEVVLYTHPSISERIHAAAEFAEENHLPLQDDSPAMRRLLQQFEQQRESRLRKQSRQPPRGTSQSDPSRQEPGPQQMKPSERQPDRSQSDSSPPPGGEVPQKNLPAPGNPLPPVKSPGRTQ